MNDLVFGKYIPIDSLIHRLDPRGKIVALLIMVSSIFISDSWYNFLFIAILLSIEVLLAKLSIKFIISAFKPMIVMMIFCLLFSRFPTIQILFQKDTRKKMPSHLLVTFQNL